MMLALCYPLLISLAAAATEVSPICYMYCKSQQFELIKGTAPPTCNCADMIHPEIELKDSSSTKLHDTGIYFVPAEKHLVQEQFASQPFFISNPAQLVPKTMSTRIHGEFDASKEMLNDPLASQSAHVEIYEGTATISHTTINQEFKSYPLYLDLEIGESTNNERAAVQKNILFEDFISTEQALLECLDFQVLNYTREYGINKKIQEFWESRNLSKYEHLSSSVIQEKIREYCKETESIVQQSLQDIKQGLPRKVLEAISDQGKGDGNSNINGETNTNAISFTDLTRGVENTTSLFTSVPLYDNSTEDTEPYNKSTEQNIGTKRIMGIHETTYDPMEDWPFARIASTTSSQDNIYGIGRTSNTSAETGSDVNASTTENPLFIKNPGNPVTSINQSKGFTSRDIAQDLDTIASEDVVHTYITTKTTDNYSALGNNTTLLYSPDTFLTIEESSGIKNATTEATFLKNQTSNNNNIGSYDTSDTSRTGAFSQVRNTYAEKEIKISKISTKECNNNTVLTTIDGTEDLPNNDFTDITTEQSENFETSMENNNYKSDITGKLYFVFKKELLPVRFVQTNTGHISLGLDGVALCDKLIHKTNKKSSLLTILCDNMQKNMYVYQNKNSTIL